MGKRAESTCGGTPSHERVPEISRLPGAEKNATFFRVASARRVALADFSHKETGATKSRLIRKPKTLVAGNKIPTGTDCALIVARQQALLLPFSFSLNTVSAIYHFRALCFWSDPTDAN